MLIACCVGLWGAILGSFLNVVIYRLPRMLETPSKHFNLFIPRSFCPHCRTTIPIWHNIPCFSFLWNRARCFACHMPISKQYFYVECLNTFLTLLAFYHFGPQYKTIYACILIAFILCISWIDAQHQLIPDTLSLGLLWVGLYANLDHTFTSLPDAVIGAMVGYASLWIFVTLYGLIFKKQAMGHGDFKLFSAMGAWFGVHALLPILCVASLLGVIIGGGYLYITHQSKQTPIPFGPFLCGAGLLYLYSTIELIQRLLYT